MAAGGRVEAIFVGSEPPRGLAASA